MKFSKFCKASKWVQKTVVMFHGALLMQRSVKGIDVELYQVDDFYVEIFYKNNHGEIFQVKCYADPGGIEAYLQLIDLAEIKGLLNC